MYIFMFVYIYDICKYINVCTIFCFYIRMYVSKCAGARHVRLHVRLVCVYVCLRVRMCVSGSIEDGVDADMHCRVQVPTVKFFQTLSKENLLTDTDILCKGCV